MINAMFLLVPKIVLSNLNQVVTDKLIKSEPGSKDDITCFRKSLSFEFSIVSPPPTELSTAMRQRACSL